jgi:hypothetical protein
MVDANSRARTYAEEIGDEVGLNPIEYGKSSKMRRK